jgi:putative ABC transport system permease protein
MPRDFLDWRERKDLFDQVSLIGGGLYTLLGSGDPEQVRIARVTAGYFEMLRTDPARGRTFTTDDEYPDRPKVTIISDGFWRTRFQSDPDIIGKILRLDGQPFEIVGVLPATFEYPVGDTQQTRIFLPVTFSARDRQRGIEQSRGYNPQARLREGATLVEAEQALGWFQASVDHNKVGFNKGYTRAELKPLIELYVSDARSWMLTLLGAVGLVLLIACANVANLVLAHGSTRARELTMRGALGAGRWRIVRQLLSESLVLSSVGAAAGLVVAWWCLGLLRTTLPASIPRAANIGLDGRVLAFAAGITLLTAVLSGLVPAIQSSRLDLIRALKGGAINTGATGRRMRNGLAIVEVALALILLIGAGLFISSFVHLLNVSQGFDPSGVMSYRIAAPRTATPAPNGYRPQMLDMLSAIRALPGIEAAAAESGGPYEGGYSSFPITIPGRPVPGPNEEPEMIRFRKVSAGFLEMLRVPLLAGRGFTRDDASGVPVALINDRAARRFWGERNPIGQPITIEETTYEIVGVVGSMHYAGPAAALAPEAFLPFEQTARSFATFIFRGPETLAPAVKTAIWSVVPAQPVSELFTAEATFGRATATRRFNMFVMAIFAALALTIAVTGIYGVMAFLTNQRRQEVGVRMALGSQRWQVIALFLRDGGTLLGTGILAGLLGAWFLSRTVQSLLFGIEARDPMVFAIVVAILAVVGFVACWVPARRASRVDPLAALRSE